MTHSKMRLIVASNNSNKLREFREILGERFDIVSMHEAGIDADIEENGTTFEEIDSIDFTEKEIDDDALFDEEYENACEFEWECQTGR